MSGHPAPPEGACWVADRVRERIPNAEVAPDLDLLRAALRALRPEPFEGPLPRWVLVRCALGHGSGVGVAICDAVGLDPDEQVPAEPLPEWLTEALAAEAP